MIPPALSGDGRTWHNARFFNRIKRQVAPRWHPDEAYRQRDPTGKLYGAQTKRYTELRVELTSDGGLRDVEILQSCGLEFLDEEALVAFRGAPPFRSPPEGIIDADGVIRFRFGFLFSLTGPPQMRYSRLSPERRSADAGVDERDGT